MKVYLLPLTGIALVLGATAVGQDTGRKNRDGLQGVWLITATEADGKAVPGAAAPNALPRLAIRGNKFQIEEGNRTTTEGTFEIDVTAKPKGCRVTEGGRTYLGIYELDGDSLKVCLGADRPDRFEAAAGSGRLLLTCRRAVTGPAAEAVKGELARLRGTWALTLALVEGRKSTDVAVTAERNQWTFTDDHFTIRRADQPGRVVKAAYTIDPTASPATIDIVPAEGPDKGKVCEGIYQLEEGSLTLCVASPGFARPKDFAAPGGSGCVLTVYKRERP